MCGCCQPTRRLILPPPEWRPGHTAPLFDHALQVPCSQPPDVAYIDLVTVLKGSSARRLSYTAIGGAQHIVSVSNLPF